MENGRRDASAHARLTEATKVTDHIVGLLQPLGSISGVMIVVLVFFLLDPVEKTGLHGGARVHNRRPPMNS